MVEDFTEDAVVSLGILANVKGRHMKAKGPYEATDTPEQSLGDGLAAVRREGVMYEPELLEESLHPLIVLARHVRGAGGETGPSVHEPLADEGALKAVGLLGVDSLETVIDLRKRGAVLLEARGQRARDGDYRRRVRKGLDQLVDEPH